MNIHVYNGKQIIVVRRWEWRKGLNEVKEKKNLFRLSFVYQCKRLSSTRSFNRKYPAATPTRKGWCQEKKSVLPFSLKRSFNKRISYIFYRQHTSFIQRHLSKELGSLCS